MPTAEAAEVVGDSVEIILVRRVLAAGVVQGQLLHTRDAVVDTWR